MSSQTASAAKELCIPPQDMWVPVDIKGFETRLSDDTHIKVPSYSISVAQRYPTFSDGSLVADVKQTDVAEFLRNYNESRKLSGKDTFRYPVLFEDEQMRDYLGKDHAMFDENFNRNEMPYQWGYIADFTRPYGNGAEGVEINGSAQPLVTRRAYWRTLDGDVELGPVTIAPDGMVPSLGRNRMEKMIGAKGLKRLEQLRGKEIYEKGDEIVDVRNALGYAQLTLAHDAHDNDGQLISHSHHSYRPEQNYDEAVGVRDADWHHRGVLWCFDVLLDVDPAGSASGRSFPLVRGGGVEAEIVRQSRKVRL